MQRPISPFTALLFKGIGPLEKILIVVVLAGGALKYLHLNGANELLLISMSSLAIVFYLMGFKPPQPVEGGESEKKGFNELLAGVIVPKIGWIGCAVVTIGALFALLYMKGASEMLLIGSAVLSFVCVISVHRLAIGSVFTPILTRLLYRAVPLCIFGWYLFMNLPPAGA